MICQARQENGENREAYYKKCEPHYATLKKISLILEQAAPRINKLEELQQGIDRKMSRRFYFQAITMLIGLLVSISTFIYILTK
ncbi:MAG: hypothetical protein Q9M20_05150 [Mariprofundaceae bacterium]|nr:hypothetical protein [Mariprofundaceae bacterium]